MQATNPNLENELHDFEPAYLQYLRPDRGDERNLRSLMDWMARFGRLDGARTLDVGAGSGKLVRFLRAHGVEARGVEPSRALFDHFLQDDQAFAHGLLDQAGFAPRSLDAISAFDVIEHVREPLAFIEQIAKLLKPQGIFYVSTPDVGSLTAKAFGRSWHFYHDYHLSYFSPATLTEAAARFGFTRLDSRHRGRFRSIGYMMRYAVEIIGTGAAPRWFERFDDWYLPINLFDTMYLAFRLER